MTLQFVKLTEPTTTIVEAFNRWENDPKLVPFTRPSKNQEELEQPKEVTLEGLKKRLSDHDVFLIYQDDKLIGEMNYMINPGHLYKNDEKTAWIGINIGETEGRGKGVGYDAILYIEEQIKNAGINRVELGVFEFNEQAHKLYQKLGYKEITRIADLTYWDGKMWCDIRMEKYL